MVRKASGCACSGQCDQDLPARGLDLDTKLFLLQQIEENGGLKTSKRWWLSNLFQCHPSELGCRESKKRERVAFIVDRWKRSNWKDVKKDLHELAAVSSNNVLSPPSSPRPDIYSQSSLSQGKNDTVPKRRSVKPPPTAAAPVTPPRPVKEAAMSSRARSSASIGSPLRLMNSRPGATAKKHEETYNADLENEDHHGDYIVGLCLDEVIDKKHASCVYICRPNTNPKDIEHFNASIVDGHTIKIVGPAHSKTFIVGTSKWIASLTKYQDKFSATKLIPTLQSTMTKFARRDRFKTTYINFSGSLESNRAIELTNEYFTAGLDESELSPIPLPYSFELDVGGYKQTVTEVMVIWRAYIVGSAVDIVDTKAKTKSDYDIMVEMMKGMKGI